MSEIHTKELMKKMDELFKPNMDPAKDWDCFRVDDRIAMIVGVAPAMMFDTIYRKVKYQSNFEYGGRKWIRMSYQEWNSTIRFFSLSRIRSSVEKLKKRGLIDTMTENCMDDRRLCITVNEDTLAKLLNGEEYYI